MLERVNSKPSFLFPHEFLLTIVGCQECLFGRLYSSQPLISYQSQCCKVLLDYNYVVSDALSNELPLILGMFLLRLTKCKLCLICVELNIIYMYLEYNLLLGYSENINVSVLDHI